MIDLDALAQAASCLEPLPTSVTHLAALVCEAAPELAAVVEVVRYDEALTATLLRAANSSWSTSRVEITTLRDAVVRLGAGPVLSLALAVNVRARMHVSIPQYGLSEGALWRHSVAASLAAELITHRALHRPPLETATAALLHDVGKLVMARFLDADVLATLADAHACSGSCLLAERAVLGIDHAELGGMIAESWSLPEPLVRAIATHHHPVADADLLTATVYLADLTANAIGFGVGEAADPDATTLAAAVVGFDPNGLDELGRLTAERFGEVCSRFG